MIRFDSDYTEGCIPEILQALNSTNDEQTIGYMEDPHCANARRLIETLGEPVYMTSANQSGHPVSTSLAEIEASCPLLDGMMEGSPSFGQASTIIDCTGEEIRILRPGPVTMNDIEQVLKQ